MPFNRGDFVRVIEDGEWSKHTPPWMIGREGVVTRIIVIDGKPYSGYVVQLIDDAGKSHNVGFAEPELQLARR